MPSIRPKPEDLVPLIFMIRGEKVLLDTDLAALYGVAGLFLYGRFKRRLRHGHALAPLLDQLHKDRACVEDNLP